MNNKNDYSLRDHQEWLRTKTRADTQRYRQMRLALREIARKGCERLTDPSTCRKPNGYPRNEWCDGCIAAEGLGLPTDWFVMKR